MKKLIAILVVFALVATAVFAQDTGITVGGWGRGVFEPFKYVKADGADAVAGAAVSTHWLSGAAVGVSFTGNAEKVGFAVDFRAGQFDPAFGQNYEVGVGDQADIWVKPLSFLTIVAGHMDAGANNYFRGQVNNFGGFAQAVHATGDEDTIFRGFGVGNGGLILLTPIDGLTIGGLLDAGGNLGRTYEGTPDDDTYKKLQIAAGYQIGTIGLLRAQFIGGTNTIDFTQSGADANFNADGQEGLATYNRIEAAFALTAVDGLTLDIGGKIPLAVTDELATVDYTYQAPFEVAVGVNFGAGDFSIGGRVELGFAESVKVEGVSDKFA
jgi:hypothetical protein